MRIIGGHLRGLKLAEIGAGDPAAHLRPTTDRVRETMFNLLINSLGIRLEGMRVLDLFAGTGALGLEALSRGAARAFLAERDQPARRAMEANIARLGAEARLIAHDATALPPAPAPADILFLDPPYGEGLAPGALKSALSMGWVAPHS